MVDFVVLAALVDSVASFLQTWSGRAVAVLVGLGILGIVFRNLISRVFDALMEELLQRTEGVPYLHAVLKRLHPQTATEILDHQEETKDHVEDIHEEVVTTSVELLEDQGLERLTEGNFDPGKRDPEACWRRPFEFAEIRAEFAIDRQRTDDERTDVTEDLLGKLQAEEGQSQIVVGPPGSGKTTVCKTVATEWYESEELGPVFYRESGATHSITDPGDVVEGLSELLDDGAGGRVLVVVEDAVRAGTIRIHKAIDDCPSDLDVSFLLDAREHEWDDFGVFVRTNLETGTTWDRVLQNRTRNVERYEMPGLDPEEVGRIVAKFAKVTDTNEDHLPSKETLHERIRGDVALEGGQVGPSPMLLLTYHFPVGGVDVSGANDETSALRRHVKDVFTEVGGGNVGADSDLLAHVALLVSVLSAAELGVHEEFVQTLVGSDGERADVENYLRNDLNGLLTYGQRGDDGKQYWSNHELWSQVYLDHFKERVGDRTARNKFGEVVSEFLTIADGEDANPGLWQWYQSDTDLLGEIEALPTEKADEYLSGVFDIGHKRPGLAPLLGRTNEYDPIAVPEACSGTGRATRALRRGNAYLRGGAYEVAREEYETARRVSEELGVDKKVSQAPILNNLGIIERRQGDYDDARDFLRRALVIFEDIGHRNGEADTLANLGNVAVEQGDYDDARDFLRRALVIFEDIGDRNGEASTLNNLGIVAQNQGDYDVARDFYHRALDIRRDIGDRNGEADTLGNLGNVAHEQGDYDVARNFYDRALDVFEDIGDRDGEATALNNLGIVAQNQGDYDVARDFYHRALDIRRDIGDRNGEADTLGNLGNVAHEQGDYDVARNFYDRALDVFEDIGDRDGEATALNNLGVVTALQGDYDDARDFYHHALDIRRNIGDRKGEAETLANLGNLASHEKDFDAAKDHYEDAADIFHDIGALRELLQVYENIARLCEEQGGLERAVKWCITALSTIEDADIPGLEEKRETFETLLGRVRSLEQPVEELYADALESVLKNEGGIALRFFRHAWDKRDETSEDQHPTALAAGLGVAAHIELLDEEGSDEEKRAILEKIRPDRHQLSYPVDTVFEYLAEGVVGVTPTELLNSTAPELAGAYKQSVEELDRNDLEVLAFTRLLEMLTDSGPEFPEGDVVAGYKQALRRILRNEGGDSMRTLYNVWGQRDSIDEGADEFSSVLSAGIAFAALLHFVNSEEADEDREEILDEIAQYEDRLDQPKLAVYEYLTEGATETSPEELRNKVSKEWELDLNDLECIAFARFLEEAQGQERGAITTILRSLKSWLS